MKAIFDIPEPSDSNARDGWAFAYSYLSRVADLANSGSVGTVTLTEVECVIKAMLMVQRREEEPHRVIQSCISDLQSIAEDNSYTSIRGELSEIITQLRGIQEMQK